MKIEKGKLRGVVSNGMLCSLKELNLTVEHDYPDAAILAAAILDDYKPLDPEKPSIPADIQPGHKIYGACGVRQDAGGNAALRRFLPHLCRLGRRNRRAGHPLSESPHGGLGGL